MKRLSLLYILIAVSLFGRDWHENYKSSQHVWYDHTIEDKHPTFATFDSSCVKFGITSNAWTMDMFNTTGRDVFRIKNNGTWRVFDGSDSTFASAGYLHVFEDSPTADGLLFKLGTSDDASRFSVDEDGDVTIDGNTTLGGLDANAEGLYF